MCVCVCVCVQVLFGLPLGLGPCTSYTMHFFTQSSSFHNTCPYHCSLFCCNTRIMYIYHISRAKMYERLSELKACLCHYYFVLGTDNVVECHYVALLKLSSKFSTDCKYLYMPVYIASRTEYCGEHIFLGFCVHSYLMNHRSKLCQIFSVTAVAQSSGGIVIRCVLLILWMISCLHGKARSQRQKGT